MGDEPRGGAVMKRASWRLVNFVSRALDSAERDAVLGDLAERGESSARALADVHGLVVRRQAALWMDWRPWMILVGLILPLAMLLSIAARMTGNASATYAWLYANNWDWALLKYAEFWYELRDSVWFLLQQFAPLACFSWTAGFVLGWASRRLIPVNGVLFSIALLAAGAFAAPRYITFWWEYVQRSLNLPPHPYQDDPVSAIGFYRLVFPVILLALAAGVPSLWGMRRAADLRTVRPLARAAVCIAAIVTLAALVIREPGVGFFLAAYRHPEIWRSWQLHALQFVVYWPPAYLIANAVGRRWRRIHA